jgi:SSS family solute:Na+ symporter
VLPVLFQEQFPSWLAGLAFAAIGIGGLVPAAIMSIAAANLWTRNIYKEYLRPDATAEQETRQAKIISAVVKAGAVAFIVWLPQEDTINFQLIGGVIILQTLPIVAIALYTRWLHRWGLLSGWAVGLAWGVWMLYSIPNRDTGAEHFGGRALELGTLSILGWEPFEGSKVEVYPGFVALLGNLVVAAAVTIVLRRWKVPNGEDETKAVDYHADGSPSGLKEGNDSGGRRATL